MIFGSGVHHILTRMIMQLLRARRVTQAIPVRELHVPFVIKKVVLSYLFTANITLDYSRLVFLSFIHSVSQGSLKFVEMTGQTFIGIDFVYTSTAKVDSLDDYQSMALCVSRLQVCAVPCKYPQIQKIELHSVRWAFSCFGTFLQLLSRPRSTDTTTSMSAEQVCCTMDTTTIIFSFVAIPHSAEGLWRRNDGGDAQGGASRTTGGRSASSGSATWPLTTAKRRPPPTRPPKPPRRTAVRPCAPCTARACRRGRKRGMRGRGGGAVPAVRLGRQERRGPRRTDTAAAAESAGPEAAGSGGGRPSSPTASAPPGTAAR